MDMSIINKYVYDLDHGISMFHRHCPNQKTYSKDGILLREIEYGEVEKSKSGMNHIIYYYDFFRIKFQQILNNVRTHKASPSSN